MRFDPESAQALGWDELKKALASFSQTTLGRTLCLSRQPMVDANSIKLEQSRHAQLRFFLDNGNAPPLGHVEDVEEHLHRAQKGGVLAPEAIIQVAQAMTVSSRLRRYLMLTSKDRKTPGSNDAASAGALVDMARGSHDLDPLGRDLAAAFGPDGRLRDSASAELFTLRKKAESLSDSIRNKLEGMIRSKRVSAALSDPVVTMRADRYVLPVRSDSRSEVDGIVHDTSQTGATLFIEPSSVVDHGNKLIIARGAVAEEERKILAQYSQEIARAAQDLRDNLDMMARLDMLNASVRLAIATRARLPELSDAGFYLKGARHPLMSFCGEDVVSNDIQLQGEARALILSGPNAGGKTVALKTVGLCCMMAQAGLAIPVEEGSKVGVFKHIFAVIGDAQDISSGLSTFSAHISSIIHILDQASDSSLVLLDELAADTDPEQGAALASSILQELVQGENFVVATTHYERLKLLAFEDHRFSNASVGFDLDEMKPTFCLHADTPGRSLTLDIARRIGMPESVLVRAADNIRKDERSMEKVLSELDDERQRISSLRAELRQATRKANEQAEQHAVAKRRLEEKERSLMDEGQKEILAEIAQARKEVSRLIEDLREDTSMHAAVAASHGLIGLEKNIQAKSDDEELPGEDLSSTVSLAEAVEPGDMVKVKALGKSGPVISVDRRGHMLTVQLGSIRTRVAMEQVQPIEKSSPKAKKEPVHKKHKSQETSKEPEIHPVEIRSSRNTLDLRGKRVDEALGTLDEFLDDIFAQGQPSAFIIHGHGTGALKAAVREYLADSPYARHFRSGLPEEGGDGVTVVAMR